MSSKNKGSGAFTLVEVMVATALSVLVVAVVMSLSFFSSRSFVAMTSYSDLGLASQLALDKFSREIRQAHSLSDYRSNRITFLDGNTNPVTFTYDAEARTLSRIGGGQTNVYLNDCDSLQFAIYQHTAISNTFNCYGSAFVTNAKVVQVTWSCSHQTPGTSLKNDNTQSMKVTIRNH